MLEQVKNFLGKQEKNTKNVAKERLQLVLIHDRIGVSREVLQDMEEELMAVISKYLEIDEEGLEMDLKQEDDSMALVANIPVRSLKKVKKDKLEQQK